jgi:signal peptidase I
MMSKPQSGVNGWLIALALPVVALVLVVCVGRFFYKPYYIPSESMLPTFEVGDQFLAATRGGRPPQIGDIVIVRLKDGVRIVRVVALGGDRVAMRSGVPVVNGVAARQRSDGTLALSEPEGAATAQRLTEQLPGDTRTHRILDIEQGYGAGDDVAETRVPPGHIFALGDNRDRSADSRYGPDVMGLGMPPEADIVGTPALIWAAHDSKRAWTTPR